MAAQFLGLKLRLLANTFRRSPWQIVGVAVALVYGLAAAFLAVAALTGLRLADADVAGDIVVAAGSLVVLGFLLIPLAFGVDDTLDPRRFGQFGIPTTRLAGLLAMTAFIGVPALVIAIVAVAQVVTWSRGGGPTFFAIVSAAVIVVTCVLGARVTTSLAAFVLASRRARELSGLVTLIVLVSIAPALAAISSIDWQDDGPAMLARVSDAAGWTPLGAAWAAPAHAAVGEYGAAVLALLIALGFVAVLAGAWLLLVGRMLVTPHRESRPRSYARLGWFRWLPASTAWTVAARSLTYWMRDSRYRVQLVIVPVVPLLMIVILLISGVYWQNLALLPLPVICLFLGWTIHNDIAGDSTALWMHVAANVSGLADRVGRTIPVLALGIPLIAIGAPVSASAYGDPDVAWSLVGVSSCILLCGLGISSITSASFPYPTVRPGDSPFSQPQASGGVASLVQSLAFGATVLLTLPALLLGMYGLIDPQLTMRSFWVGLAVGLVVFVGGALIGGAIFSRRAPELLAFTQRS
ncbi:ABC transporter permease [Marisediminicola senii]|uniref:ABC transporter permease n=1 Tax=Marisediminicola senii TaxID=2711233 RepID=UPI0013EC7E8F|nr:ABC transporter permease [Marisediminicola senii]